MFIIYIHKIYRNSKLFARFAHMNGLWKTLLFNNMCFSYKIHGCFLNKPYKYPAHERDYQYFKLLCTAVLLKKN